MKFRHLLSKVEINKNVFSKLIFSKFFYRIFIFIFTAFLHFKILSVPRVYKGKSFIQAKLYSAMINFDAPGTFYCNCPIKWKNIHGIPDLVSCGYKIRKDKIRANRIEWEHIVTAWEFGHLRKCWKIGGRKNCNKDFLYKKIETDLHNLQPVIGEINKDRKNYEYSELVEGKQYGMCKIKINFKNKQVEPPIYTKGVIARTYLYMKDKYNLKISKSKENLFKLWNQKYPVSNWECIRDRRIFFIQGNNNPYVNNFCKKLYFKNKHYVSN